MQKSYCHFLFLFLSFSVFAQSNITVKGKILDINTQLPLEAATVYISSVKDSSVIDYTISDKNGFFKLETKKITKPFFLKVSYMGYQNYKQEALSISEDKDFGTLYLEENPNSLMEVVIKSEAPPIRIKKDTLEFNASSFKVRPDSNVETLLKQLPGVEVSTDGKITVNGKEVNNILVNGKPFFGKDGKVATKNLPADIISKVQVTDTKTKEEELAKESASSENKTINLTIQEDKNKGLFGKFISGYGSDKRYEASGLINYFKDKQRFSFLGSSNNINSIGFSMDEVYDSMGGGRNFYNSGANELFNSGKSGITQSNMVGLNYSDQFGKKVETTGSYFFTSSESNNDNRTKQINLLADNSSTTESESTSRRIADNHKFDFDFEYKIDSLTTLTIKPNFKRSTSKNTESRSQFTINEAGDLLNDFQSKSMVENDNTSFENQIYFNKNFKKKGRRMFMNFTNTNSISHADTYNNSITNSYQDTPSTDVRNQLVQNKNTEDKYTASISYSEPITDSLSVSLGTNFNWKKLSNDVATFDFDNGTQEYNTLNNLMSSYISSKTNSVSPYVAFSIRKKKYSTRISLGTDVTRFENFSNYLATEMNLNKNYIFPTAFGYFNYKLSKTKSFYANYRFSVDLPSAYQILPVENLSNPLNTIIGNSDLEPTKNHSIYFGFNNYDYATKSGLYVYLGSSIYDKQIVSSTVYDDNFIGATTYQNTNNTYSGFLGLNWNKSIKKAQHTFKYGFGVNSNLSLTKGITNNELYEANAIGFTPDVNFTYEYGELLTVAPSYSYGYNKTKFSNYVIDESSNFVHNLKLQITSRWPKNWVLGNDLGYTYNSNIANGFKKDFYLWNSSLGYNFMKDTFLVKIKVYDILNQNVNATRTVTPTAIRDEENTVLKRYVMFSLTYKLEKFGGKKKSEF